MWESITETIVVYFRNTVGCIIDIVFFPKGRHGTVCQNTCNNSYPWHTDNTIIFNNELHAI